MTKKVFSEDLSPIYNKINWKLSTGEILKDDKRDLTIVDRKIKIVKRKDKRKRSGYTINNEKWYKYTCNVCGWTEGWIVEGSLTKGTGCSCCHGRTTVVGINSIVDTNPWMIPYFQGGYDEAKLYTYSSEKYIIAICIECGQVNNKPVKIYDIYRNKSVICSCSDKRCYPEKVMFSVLYQLGVDFTTQLSKRTFEWCDKYKYDFYFSYNNENYIIETHGQQHYKDASGVFIKTLEEEQDNDECKKQLALKNGIKEENYIVVDCRKSELEWIKQNILQSNLSDLFNLPIIDWNKAEQFALSNRVKEACDLWSSGIHNVKEICRITKLSKATIIRYLNKGSKIGWCTYSGKEESLKSSYKKNKSGKQVEIFKDNISLGVFPSCAELSRKSEELFGTKLLAKSIANICRSKNKTNKGYTFKYTKSTNIKGRLELWKRIFKDI